MVGVAASVVIDGHDIQRRFAFGGCEITSTVSSQRGPTRVYAREARQRRCKRLPFYMNGHFKGGRHP
jgi:hypothetical protein